MKISVLLPACHADPFIAAALASLRAQDHLDWELIVVEAGSRDDTAELVKRFGDTCRQPVRYEHLGEAGGPGALRNRLLELARGDAFAFLEPDDTWTPEHLALAATQLSAGAEFFVSGVCTFDLVRNRPLASLPASPALASRAVDALFHRRPILTSSSVVLARALVERVGRFDPLLGHATERDYWLRCALAQARFGLEREITCCHTLHPASPTARTYAIARQTTRFYEKYRALRAIPARMRRRLLADSLVTLGRLLRRHDPAQSLACFRRAWRFAPFNVRIPLQLAFTQWRVLVPAAGS